ncbi:MAG TPA: bifunctional tetrahydrofolate synthase/dihydrofolate synthase [Gammaproteobacteria bacterium]|nr:bifunctional tetrahydrofolate synthase/dihydrofolate synthase [Gammaproteobacteria bacterium]
MADKDLAAWLAWQERLHPREIDLGLERVRAVLGAMGLRAPPYRIVTVGGTNGKGSCVATLEALASEAGLLTGAYTSPHLLRYNERVRIGGAEAGDAELVAAFEAIDAARGDTSLTYFEFGTLAALEIFRRRGVELAVLEVGLGGRLDAVNAVDPEVAVVTSVGLDHMEWLGPDRESIGREKGGIFRPGRPAVIGDRRPPASLLLAAGADALRLGLDFDWREDGAGWCWQSAARRLAGLPRGPLAAPALLDNAACAIAAFAILEPGSATPGLAARALPRIALVGRLQRIPGQTEWWLDVAHNPDGAAVLAGALAAAPVRGRTLAVIGMLADKDVAAVGAALDGGIDAWFAATLPPPRGLDATTLAARLGGHVQTPVRTAPSVAAACEAARAAARPGDRVVVCGSFHAVGPALEWLGVYCEPLTE